MSSRANYKTNRWEVDEYSEAWARWFWRVTNRKVVHRSEQQKGIARWHD